MIIAKLIGCTCSSWSLDWLIPTDNKADEEQCICSFSVFKSDFTQCWKIPERPENYTGFCCSNKLHLQGSSQLWKEGKQMNPVCIILDRPALRDLSEPWQALVSRYFLHPVANSCRMPTTLKPCVSCSKCSSTIWNVQGVIEWTTFHDSSNRNKTNYICLMVGPTLR